MQRRYKKIVIGVDQSYTATGISVIADGKPLLVNSLDFKGCKSPSEKRECVRNVIDKLCKKATQQAKYVVIYVERIRTVNVGANAGGRQRRGFGAGTMNISFIKKSAALLAVITDAAYNYGIDVYSVDTRSWKSKVVGNSKARKTKNGRDTKSETVEFVQKKYGIDLFKRFKRGTNEAIYDDDAADSCCIGLYGFINNDLQKLQKED